MGRNRYRDICLKRRARFVETQDAHQVPISHFDSYKSPHALAANPHDLSWQHTLRDLARFGAQR